MAAVSRPVHVVAQVIVAGALTIGPVAAQARGTTGNDYADGNNWLCRPGRRDACVVDLNTTIVRADGTLTPEGWTPNPDAAIDCFYVYPTVSTELTANSDMALRPEERAVARAQFARFGSVCRLYAPLYRQVTLAGIRRLMLDAPLAAEQALAYNDVRDAWNYYLAHDNDGRGVVLIGHSQGSTVLTELIKNEVDGKPGQVRLVSAVLAGASIPVPRGKDVGGAFHSVPLCRAAAQTGCLITYASYRATAPPPANALFGRVSEPGMIAACTNPAALAGGSGELHAYFGAQAGGIVASVDGPQRGWVTPPKPITTPWVSVPGMLTAECAVNEHGSYLAITVHGDSHGPRASDIAGDVVIAGQIQANWGLHLVDVNLAQGNLIDIIRQEAATYVAAHSRQ